MCIRDSVGTVADIGECWSKCQDLNSMDTTGYGEPRTSYCASLHQTTMECSCQGADPDGDFDELECLEDVGEYTLAVHEGWRGSRCYGNDGRVCACDGGDYCLPSEDEDDECTPGWRSMNCLDETVMYGEGCTSCGDLSLIHI